MPQKILGPLCISPHLNPNVRVHVWKRKIPACVLHSLFVYQLPFQSHPRCLTKPPTAPPMKINGTFIHSDGARGDLFPLSAGQSIHFRPALESSIYMYLSRLQIAVFYLRSRHRPGRFVSQCNSYWGCIKLNLSCARGLRPSLVPRSSPLWFVSCF